MNKAVKIPICPPKIAGISLLVALGLHFLTPRILLIAAPYHLLGPLFFIAGLALMLWAFGLFKNLGTTHLPHETPTTLVARGPYRFTRNPMYVGMSAMLLGIAVYAGSLPLFLAPIAFCLATNARVIQREEAVLESEFGPAYLEYKRRVRRWL